MSWWRKLFGIGVVAGAVATGAIASAPKADPAKDLATPVVAVTDGLGPQGSKQEETATARFEQAMNRAVYAADSANYVAAQGAADEAAVWIDKIQNGAQKDLASRKQKIFKNYLEVIEKTNFAIQEIINKMDENSGRLGAEANEQISLQLRPQLEKYIEVAQTESSQFARVHLKDNVPARLAVLIQKLNGSGAKDHAEYLAQTLQSIQSSRS